MSIINLLDDNKFDLKARSITVDDLEVNNATSRAQIQYPINLNRNATTALDGQISTTYKIIKRSGNYTLINTQDFTLLGNGQLIASKQGLYQIHADVSLSNNTDIDAVKFGIQTNNITGGEFNELGVIDLKGQPDIENLSFSDLLQINEGDEIEFQIEKDSGIDEDIYIHHLKLILIRIL